MADSKPRILSGIFRRSRKAEEEPATGPLDPGTEKLNKLPPRGDELIAGRFPHPMFIRHRGLADIDRLYRFMAGWLKDHKYELHETLYKFKPPEMELRWRAERRKSGFIMEIIHVHIHFFGEYDLEVVDKGKKKKMSNVRMTIELNAEVRAPYENMFGERRWNAPMERRLLRFFHNYVLKREIELLTLDALYYELLRFHAAVKDHLNLAAKGHAYYRLR